MCVGLCASVCTSRFGSCVFRAVCLCVCVCPGSILSGSVCVCVEGGGGFRHQHLCAGCVCAGLVCECTLEGAGP